MEIVVKLFNISHAVHSKNKMDGSLNTIFVPVFHLFQTSECVPVYQTWVEVPSRVERSAVDIGGKSVAADGLRDVGIEVSIKPK